MTTAQLRPLSEIFHYHAHIYFDADSRTAALAMRELVASRFAVDMGRVFEQPVGPHPLPQYEIGFEPALFATLVPWLMLNRAELSVLIHPNTDQERHDHMHSAMWLGAPLPLSEARLVLSLRESGQSLPRPVVINTSPTIGI